MRRALRWGFGAMAVAVAAASAVLGTAGVASAHVTVNPKEAVQGGYARVAFRVPNESATAKTVKLEVYLPQETPLTSVSVQPVPGWTAQLHKTKLDKPVKGENGDITDAVTHIEWAADTPEAQIASGQFQEFGVSMGPMPKIESMTFKALQTYSDGNVVRWIEISDGKTKPAKPAPVLKLTASDPAATVGTVNVAQTSTAKDDDGDDKGTLALWLGAAGLVAGLAGLGMGSRALARTRRT